MKKGDFYLIFSFFVNNSRTKGPTPVFLSYLDLPYAIEGGSTTKKNWVLNNLCTAIGEAILKHSRGQELFVLSCFFFRTLYKDKNFSSISSCFKFSQGSFSLYHTFLLLFLQMAPRELHVGCHRNAKREK